MRTASWQHSRPMPANAHQCPAMPYQCPTKNETNAQPMPCGRIHFSLPVGWHATRSPPVCLNIEFMGGRGLAALLLHCCQSVAMLLPPTVKGLARISFHMFSSMPSGRLVSHLPGISLGHGVFEHRRPMASLLVPPEAGRYECPRMLLEIEHECTTNAPCLLDRCETQVPDLPLPHTSR